MARVSVLTGSAVIDQPAPRNGENPTEEVALRALEPIDAGADPEPHLGSEILAVLRLLSQQIAENPRLERAVEVSQRLLVTALCGCERGSEVLAEGHPLHL
jgi:hypothetical protein